MELEGLHIRRAEPEDCAALYDLFSCPKVVAGTLQLPYQSRETWRQRLSPDSKDGTNRLVAVLGDQIIGTIDIHTNPDRPRRRHVGAIGMAVHDDWQGKGVGKALMQAAVELADKWLNLTRLELEVYTDNQAGIKLYERFGFEHEGTLRQDAFRDGRYVDCYKMARLRPAPSD